MKKIITIIFILILIISSIVNAQTNCNRGDTSTLNIPVTWCATGGASVNTDRVLVSFYQTEAQALAAAQAAYPGFVASYSTNNGSNNASKADSWITQFGGDTRTWGAYQIAVGRCGFTSGNYYHYRVYAYQKTSWIDENSDCVLDSDKPEESCLKYKPLMKVKDKSSGCLYFAKIMDEKCNVSVLGDSSIINKAMSGDIDVEIQSFNSPSRNNESTCEMGSSYYDCNNGFTETACSGYNLTKDDNKNNPSVQNVQDGQYNQNKNLSDATAKQTGDTDSTLLGKIVDNTGAIVTNQQSMSDQMTQIANLIQDQKSYNAETSIHEVVNEMQNQESRAKEAYDNRNNTIQNADASQYEGQSKFNESDEYSNDINGKIEDISPDGTISGLAEKYHDNTYLQGFRNSQIEIIDSYCSINMPFKAFGFETDIEIDLCEFDDILTTVGNVFYYIVVIGSLITVLKGRGA